MVSRWTVTTAEGAVIGCGSQADLVEALVAVRLASDALAAPAARRRPADTAPKPKPQADDGGWTASVVRSFLTETTTKKTANMLRAAISLGDGATAAQLATELKRPPGALGPMLAKLARDAAYLGDLPPPLITTGKPGAKTLAFDPGFLAAYKEVTP